jgi:hypothetical protein
MDWQPIVQRRETGPPVCDPTGNVEQGTILGRPIAEAACNLRSGCLVRWSDHTGDGGHEHEEHERLRKESQDASNSPLAPSPRDGGR